jgi:hypothetical protein
MECRELTEFAVSGLLGEVDEKNRREMDAHLSDCSDCREELAKIEAAWDALGRDPDLQVSSDFRHRSLELLEEEMVRRRVREFRPRRRWVAVAAQAAAILVAAAIGWALRRPASSPAPAANQPPEGTLSNVTYRQPDADGKVAVSFDVTRHKTVLGRPEDPAVATLLAYLVSQGTRTAGKIANVSWSLPGTGQTPAGLPEIVRALPDASPRQNPGVRKRRPMPWRVSIVRKSGRLSGAGQ